MKRVALFRASVAVAFALLGGCATKAPPPPPVPVVRSIKISAADYVAAAASYSLFVVKASELLAGRDGEGAVGQFAIQAKAEQVGVGAQLSMAGRRLNLLPSATLLPPQQAMLAALRESSDAQATYIAQLKSLLPKAATLHHQYARYGTSPTLRPVAAMAAPVLDREVARLRRY